MSVLSNTHAHAIWCKSNGMCVCACVCTQEPLACVCVCMMGAERESFTKISHPPNRRKSHRDNLLTFERLGWGWFGGGGRGVGLGWGRASPSNRVRLNREVQQTDWQMLFMLKSTLFFVNSFPVPKSTNAKSEGDFHPISRHSFFSRHSEMYERMKRCDLPEFSPNRSTITLLWEITESLRTSLNSGVMVIFILLEF